MFYLRFSLKSNEQYEQIALFAQQNWAICSGHSEEMSDVSKLLKFAHKKWANEWIAHFYERIAYSLIFWQKTSDSLGNQMSEFPALVLQVSWEAWINIIILNRCINLRYILSRPCSIQMQQCRYSSVCSISMLLYSIYRIGEIPE